jgi:hypothetical protein
VHIPRQYIVNEDNERVAVQVDIATFEMIEEWIENHGLAEQMAQAEDDDSLDLTAARAFYAEQTG